MIDRMVKWSPDRTTKQDDVISIPAINKCLCNEHDHLYLSRMFLSNYGRHPRLYCVVCITHILNPYFETIAIGLLTV